MTLVVPMVATSGKEKPQKSMKASHSMISFNSILVTETYANISSVVKYYQSVDGKRRGSHFPFNFGLLSNVYPDSNALDLQRIILEWMVNMPKDGTANWVVSCVAVACN